MALGAYGSELGRGSVLNALAHPNVVNPVADITAGVSAARGITDLRSQQFTLQQAQLQPAYQSMRMLMATNPNPSWDDVNAALAQSARIGGNIDGIVANANEIAGKGGKPADFMRATALGGMSSENQTLMGVGQPISVDTGGNIVYGMRGGPLSAAPGQFTGATSIAKGFTPTEASEFIAVPDVDANGRPTGTTHLMPRASVVSPSGGWVGGNGGYGGGGGPAGGGGGAQPPGPPPGSSIQPGQPLSQKDADLAQFAQRESGNQNIFSRVPPPPGYTQQQTGSGYYQIIPSTWAEGQQLAGIPPNQRTQLAIQASPQQQYAVASALYDKYGGRPWAQSAPGGAGGGGGGGGGPAAGPFIGATSAQPVTGGSVVQPGGGGAANVQPASGMQYLDPTGRPIVQGGGGGIQMPGVQRGPGGAPILTPPAPWMGPLWEQSAKEYSNDVSREAGLASRIQPFQSALSIINAHPDLKTGPTSQQWNNWATTLQQWGVQLPSMPGDSVAAYQELSKALHQGLVNSGAFSGTDMARLEAEASSPNIQQNVEAIRELSARQIGYERFQIARLKYFRSQHPGEDPDQYANQYRTQMSQWASNLDPVAFGADHLTDQEIATYLKGLNPADQQRFRNSVKEAAKLYPDFAKAGK
jgi:hypothetical protein